MLWHCQAQASPHCAPGASEDDQAIYICEAQNEFGKIRAEVKLAVTGHGLLLCAFVGVLIPAAASTGCASGRPVQPRLLPSRPW